LIVLSAPTGAESGRAAWRALLSMRRRKPDRVFRQTGVCVALEKLSRVRVVEGALAHGS
jgi:hypothetical protein